MKKNIWSKLIAVLVIVGVLTAMTFVAVADFGDFSGDRDYGGWDDDDSGGCSGSDSDDDDDRDYSWCGSCISYDNHSSNNSSKSGSGSGGIGIVFAIIAGLFLVIFGIILLVRIISSKKDKQRREQARREMEERRTNWKPLVPGGLNSIDSYKKEDPDFDEAVLKEQIAGIYAKMRDCRTEKSLAPLKQYFTEELYAKLDQELEDSFRKTNITSHTLGLSVLGVTLRGWRVSGDNDEISATIRARFIEYDTDDITRKVVSGSMTTEKFIFCEWIMSRKRSGAEAGEARTICCPYCNASLDISKGNKCEYCGSVVNIEPADWVISEIKALSQR